MERNGDYPQDCSPITQSKSGLSDIQEHPAYQKLLKEKEEMEKSLENIQSEFIELSEYVNKLEPSYNQSLQYISHIESIMANVLSYRKQFIIV